MTELLSATGLAVEYGRRGKRVRAVDGVDLAVAPGEILGLVGESGCGKSSIARAIVGLEPTSSGTVSFRGSPVEPIGLRRRSAQLRGLQMVFQDPYASLNPRRKIGELIADGVLLNGGDRSQARRRTIEIVERVGMSTEALTKYPHEFSGGQRQRLAIARALAAEPTCIVADEPISALDASAQAQVANLLLSLVRANGMGMVFISHDLSVVRQIADRVAVMYLGRIVEYGPTGSIWGAPTHPYTEALVSAIPRADGSGTLPIELRGEVPSPAQPPTGCRFHPRCRIAEQRCKVIDPSLSTVGEGQAACIVRVAHT